MENYNDDCKPISVKEWIITGIITSIPIVGIVMMFVWAFKKDTNPNKANWAKAMLIVGAIMIIIMLIVSSSMPSYMSMTESTIIGSTPIPATAP